MHTLDSRTLLFIIVLMGPVLAMVLLSLRRSYPGSVHGLGWWAQGTGWSALAALLLSIREVLPNNTLLNLLGAICMPIGAVQWTMGTEKFLGLPSSAPRLCWIAALGTTGLVWFMLIEPDFGWRYAALSLTMATLHLTHCRRLLQQDGMESARRFLALALFALALSWLMRAGGALTGVLSTDLFSNARLNTVLHVLQAACYLLCLIGFVLLAGERIRAEFERLASHDSLTGALLRRAWMLKAQIELERSVRHNRPLALVAMDLDHFKNINDTLGHAAGDQALVDFTTCVTGHLRRQDFLGRTGGEEFVLLLPETNISEAHIVAERIRKALAERVQEPVCTVSMGVAQRRAEELQVASLLARADAAMYQAKSAGRNRVELEDRRPATFQQQAA